MLFSQRGEILQNLFDTFSSSQHTQNLPDHNSGSFEGKLSVADIGISNDIFVDFNSSHTNSNNSKNKNDLSSETTNKECLNWKIKQISTYRLTCLIWKIKQISRGSINQIK